MPRTLIQPWRAAVAVVLLAVVSLATWRAEVEGVKGWAGLRWLDGYPWAAVPICGLVATSILVSVRAMAPASARPPGLARTPAGTTLIFLSVMTSVAWLSFEIARRWLCADQSWLAFSPPAWTAPAGWVIAPLASIALTAVGAYLAIDRLLLRLRPWSIAPFVAALVLVMPLSWLSLQLLPAHGYRDNIHAIKAGYPTLWTNILMACAVALAARFARRL